MYTYAGDDNIPTPCTGYVIYDADGDTGLDLYVTTNGSPSGIFNKPWTIGHLNVDGLYYIPIEVPFSSPGVYTYGATLGFGGPTVDSIAVTWVSPGPPCVSYLAAPAPVLTATAAYNPTVALNNVQLDWTASVSADSRFWSIEYDVEKKVDSGAFTAVAYLHDTLAYLDVGVPIGHTYVYRVTGREPVIGQGSLSNDATPDMTVDIGPPAPARQAWGVLAR